MHGQRVTRAAFHQEAAALDPGDLALHARCPSTSSKSFVSRRRALPGQARQRRATPRRGELRTGTVTWVSSAAAGAIEACARTTASAHGLNAARRGNGAMEGGSCPPGTSARRWAAAWFRSPPPAPTRRRMRAATRPSGQGRGQAGDDQNVAAGGDGALRHRPVDAQGRQAHCGRPARRASDAGAGAKNLGGALALQVGQAALSTPSGDLSTTSSSAACSRSSRTQWIQATPGGASSCSSPEAIAMRSPGMQQAKNPLGHSPEFLKKMRVLS